MNNQVPTCAYCGLAIKGRADKKFCDETCRNSWHNNQNREKDRSLKRVNSMLKHNHRVLEYFISSGYHSVSREEVLQKGFDFRFFTHMIHEPESHQRIGCYDLSYFITENGMIEIGYSDFEKLLKRNMNARNTHLKSE